MRFERLLNKTEKGQILTEREIKFLAKKCGLIFTFSKGFLLIVLVGLAITGIILNQIYNQTWSQIMILCLILIGFVFGIAKLFQSKKTLINDYLFSLEEFYFQRLKEFEGFETIFTFHNFQKSGYLQNELCLFLTDGYSYFIFDDFLMETAHALPRCYKTKQNKFPMLKVLDFQNIKKRPISFQLSEIQFYQLTNYNKGKEERGDALGERFFRYTYMPLKEDYYNFCIVELEDHSVFKFGPEVYSVLKKRAPGKELKEQ